jgi:hypothetical protein
MTFAMTTQKISTITKDYGIQISIGLLFVLGLGVWNLSRAAFQIEARLESIERNQWSIEMERETWHKVSRTNPMLTPPDIDGIVSIFRN